MQVPHYHISVFWSDEDGAWIADVPDLASVSAHGETSASVPEPRYRPAIYAVPHARDVA